MRFPGHNSLPPKPTAAQRRAYEAAFMKWAAEEAVRVAVQRAAFQALMGPSRAHLQQLMLDRAWFLLDSGECEAADALLEFVPEAAASALLDEFFPDI